LESGHIENQEDGTGNSSVGLKEMIMTMDVARNCVQGCY